MKNKQTTYLIIALVVILPVVFFMKSFFHKKALVSQQLQLEQATLLPSAQNLPEFKLHDAQNKSFTPAQLKGHWSLIFFGFTRCPQVCPTTLAELAQAYQLLKQQKAAQLPQILFISVDPDYDSNNKLSAYVDKFHSNMIGLTGDTDELNKLAKPVGVMFEKIPGQSTKDYSMAHSNIILVINPQGQWVALMMSPHHAQTIANDFLGIQQHAPSL
jgi:protein SCO1/2